MVLLVAGQQIGPVSYSGYFGGAAVDIKGDILVGGAYGDDKNGTNCGSVSIYRRSPPKTGLFVIEAERLQHTTPEAGAYFGNSVALIDENHLVVGAPYKNNGGTNRGSVFLFTYSGGVWSQTQEIQGNADGLFFGKDVASDGVRVVVGAPEDFPYGTAYDDGWVYVYTWNGSQLVYEDSFDDAYPTGGYTHGFGNHVDIDGDTIVIGAPGIGGTAGGAFVFVRSGSTWSKEQYLLPGSKRFYGSEVAIRGETCAVFDEYGTSHGRVDIWDRSGTTWTVSQAIYEPGGYYARDHHFGEGLAFNDAGTLLLIGSPGVWGIAYPYRLIDGTWTWTEEELQWDPVEYDNDGFGRQIACGDDNHDIAVGAIQPTFSSGTKGGIKTYGDPYSVSATPGVVHHLGGQRVTLTVSGSISEDTDLTAYLGPTGDNTDAPCYSGVPGQGYVVKSEEDGETCQIVTPPATPGTHKVTLYDGESLVAQGDIVVVEAPHRNKTHQQRASFQPWQAVGRKSVGDW